MLDDEDRIVRRHILNIMCRFETSWQQPQERFAGLDACLDRLQEVSDDGLVELQHERLVVPEAARPFVRNVCMAFDLRLMRQPPETRIFSLTI